MVEIRIYDQSVVNFFHDIPTKKLFRPEEIDHEIIRFLLSSLGAEYYRYEHGGLVETWYWGFENMDPTQGNDCIVFNISDNFTETATLFKLKFG